MTTYPYNSKPLASDERTAERVTQCLAFSSVLDELCDLSAVRPTPCIIPELWNSGSVFAMGCLPILLANLLWFMIILNYVGIAIVANKYRYLYFALI